MFYLLLPSLIPSHISTQPNTGGHFHRRTLHLHGSAKGLYGWLGGEVTTRRPVVREVILVIHESPESFGRVDRRDVNIRRLAGWV